MKLLSVRLSPLENWATISVLIMFIFNMINITTGASETNSVNLNEAQGSAIRKLVLFPLYLSGFLVLWHFQRRSVEFFRDTNPFLIILCLYMLASFIWSDYPSTGLRKSVQLLGLVAVFASFYFVRRDPESFLKMMSLILAIYLPLSFITAVALPHIGTDPYHGGAWRGLSSHKNNFGQMAAIGFIIWSSAFIGKRGLPHAGKLALLALFCVIMTKSSTSLVMSMMGLGLFLLFRQRWVRAPHFGMRVGIVLYLLLLSFIAPYMFITGQFPTWEVISSPIAELTGKDTTLTGRTDLWAVMSDVIKQHFWFGTGYGSFWLSGLGGDAYVHQFIIWLPNQAHNGYIDFFNENGFVGFALFTLFLAKHLRDTLRLGSYDRHAAALYGALFLLILINNITESSFFRGTNFLALFLFFLSLGVSSSLLYYQNSSKNSGKNKINAA